MRPGAQGNRRQPRPAHAAGGCGRLERHTADPMGMLPTRIGARRLLAAWPHAANGVPGGGIGSHLHRTGAHSPHDERGGETPWIGRGSRPPDAVHTANGLFRHTRGHTCHGGAKPDGACRPGEHVGIFLHGACESDVHGAFTAVGDVDGGIRLPGRRQCPVHRSP